MESNEASVQYNRWNEDNMNMQVPHSQSRLIGWESTLYISYNWSIIFRIVIGVNLITYVNHICAHIVSVTDCAPDGLALQWEWQCLWLWWYLYTLLDTSQDTTFTDAEEDTILTELTI